MVAGLSYEHRSPADSGRPADFGSTRRDFRMLERLRRAQRILGKHLIPSAFVSGCLAGYMLVAWRVMF